MSPMREIQPEKVERGWLRRGQFQEVVREGFSKEATVRRARTGQARGRTREAASESKPKVWEDKTGQLFSETEGQTERPLCGGEGGDPRLERRGGGQGRGRGRESGFKSGVGSHWGF